MDSNNAIVTTVLAHYPNAQAIYLFGSFGTTDERPDSDVDIGVLLPLDEARRQGSLQRSTCKFALEEELDRPVDLVNVRQVSTVFQKEIIAPYRLIHCGDRDRVDEFEMLTLSYYQKLNEERKEILEAFHESGRAYDV